MNNPKQGHLKQFRSPLGTGIRSLGNTPISGKNALGVKRPFVELSESSGVFSEQLSEFEIPFSEYEIPFSEYEIHNLRNTKTTILGATPGAIPGIDGNPHERFSFAHSFSERFFENWGGPRTEEGNRGGSGC